jgi:hypothetical protein
MNPEPQSPISPTTLYLRPNGTMLLVRNADGVDDKSIGLEIFLMPEQLLTLGMDCLSLAAKLKPALSHQAAEAVLRADASFIVRQEAAPCQSLN